MLFFEDGKEKLKRSEDGDLLSERAVKWHQVDRMYLVISLMLPSSSI